ncbi:LOW QUALITY PROTEIN: hypothetical protein PHMEG_00018488 [Phytophthora megakarya]|uniref:Uncharacterized protein n=1 Tax=Phytophthora megakarya TaxID=4795 RepID=A0A225VVS6_9STRA|nr:LOW QUALITY PROTEIN: hypothetical protein PHMEG_00018488 [Phytophthora megakarya]
MIQRTNNLTILTMTLDVLSRSVPFHAEWTFPDRVLRTTAPRRDQYCSDLITTQNVRDLILALPWNVLAGLISFEVTVDDRLGFLIQLYSAVAIQDLIAHWESTHRFPVTPAEISDDPYQAQFVVEGKNRRSHAGARGKKILELFLFAMREGKCDLDLLLDPFFLHFPKLTDEVT